MSRNLLWMIALGMCLAVPAASAGSNAGGVYLLHLAPEIQYTSSNRSYCEQFDVKSFDDVRVSGKPDPSRAQVFYVLAAFDAEHSPRFKTIGFGFGEGINAEKIQFENWGACASNIMEMPSEGWPGPGSGTAVFFADTVFTGRLTPVYWFSAYVYGECQLELSAYPGKRLGAFFVDDGSPPMEDRVESFGALGFGMEGKKPSPMVPKESPEEREEENADLEGGR